MKKLYFSFTILFTTFLCFSMIACSTSSCSALKYEDFESGNFKYRLYSETPNSADVAFFSQDFLDAGEKIAIIPPYVDKKIVNGIGVQIYIGTSRLYSQTVETLYVPYTINYAKDSCIQINSLKKMVISSNQLIKYLVENKPKFLIHANDNTKYYVSSFAYENENLDKLTNEQWKNYNIIQANTSFMFNYENSPNDDYFFLDNYEYGKKINNTPYTPIRDAYTFNGWYKERECINAWNFETDTLPKALKDENDVEIYQETKLFAKWVQNN